jgi:membrane-associated phospholipid phosphatase
MDAITELALSVENPMLHDIGMLIQNPIIYAVLVLFLLLVGEKRQKKQKKLLLSLLITVVLVTAAKEAMAIDRPCADDDWCPSGFSFPSMHAAVAFTLMTGFLNKRSYVLYLLFALFISFTRLNIGVHTFYDVAAALPIALLSYYITVEIYEELMKDG